MDVTPQVINEVEFHQKMRGYDPDEVDDFLERVAVAVGQLQDRLEEAAERVSGAERRATELEARLKEVASRPAAAAPATVVAPTPSAEEDAETIRRTLVLAQRTADAAVKEAEEEAQRTVASAHEQASTLYREAQEKATTLVEEAEAEARRSGEDVRQKLVAEIIDLEESRDSLRADSGILERHLDEQRLRLRSSVAELQRLLDDPSRLRVAPLPPLSEVSRPPAVAAPEPEAQAEAEAEAEESEPEPASAPAFSWTGDDSTPPNDSDDVRRGDVSSVSSSDVSSSDVSSSDVSSGGMSTEDAPGDDVIDLEGATSRPITGSVVFTPADDLGVAAPAEDEAWARFVGDDGPPTRALDLDEVGDDAYLAELRKAMVDDGGGGGGEVFASDRLESDDRQRLRFGRRR